MDTRTNELFMLDDEKENTLNKSAAGNKLKSKFAKLLPPHLQGAAKQTLAGKKSKFISTKSRGRLARWAANERLNQQSDMVKHCNAYYEELEKKNRERKSLSYYSSPYFPKDYAEKMASYARYISSSIKAEVWESSEQLLTGFYYVLYYGATKHQIKKIKRQENRFIAELMISAFEKNPELENYLAIPVRS